MLFFHLIYRFNLSKEGKKLKSHFNSEQNYIFLIEALLFNANGGQGDESYWQRDSVAGW